MSLSDCWSFSRRDAFSISCVLCTTAVAAFTATFCVRASSRSALWTVEGICFQISKLTLRTHKRSVVWLFCYCIKFSFQLFVTTILFERLVNNNCQWMSDSVYCVFTITKVGINIFEIFVIRTCDRKRILILYFSVWTRIRIFAFPFRTLGPLVRLQ